MARVLLAALHTFLAATLVLGGTVLLIQSQLNITWEMGFYGRLSLFTTALTLTAVVMILIATVQGVSSFSYALGHRWGSWGLLLVSVFLAAGTPAPLSWILALGAAVLILELWATRERPAFEDDEDDE